MQAKTKTTQLIASLIFFAFIFSALITEAQPNLRSAYVITNQGDTLKGDVDYREWGSTPKQFSFRKAGNEQSQLYTTKDIQKITIQNRETYERFYVSISMNQTDLQRIEFVNDTTIKQDMIFLRELLNGNNLSLYSYRDYLKERFYILRADQTIPVELGYEIEREGLQTVSTDIYKTQLEQVAATFPSFSAATQQRIQNLSYSPQSLTRFVSSLNDKQQLNSEEQIKRGRFFIQAGVQYSRFEYSGESQVTADGLDASGQPSFKKISTGSILPVLGVGYDYYFQPAIRRFYLRTSLDIAAMQSKVSSFYKFPAPYDEELTNEYQLSAISLGIHPQLINHFLNKATSSFYFGLGISFNQVFYLKNRLVQVTNKQGPGYADKTTDDALRLKERLTMPSLSLGSMFGKKFGVTATGFIPTKIQGKGKVTETSVMLNSIQLKATFSL